MGNSGGLAFGTMDPSSRATWVLGGLAVAVAVLFLKVTWWRWRLLWGLRCVPGRLGLPILGDLPAIMEHDLTGLVHKLTMSKQYPTAFKFYMGPLPFVVITDLEVARRLLSKYIIHPQGLEQLCMRRPLDSLISMSMPVFMHGEPWREQRRASESALMHAKALAVQAPMMAKWCARIEQHLSRYAASGEPIDMQEALWMMAADGVGWAAFGVDMHTSEIPVDAHAYITASNGTTKKSTATANSNSVKLEANGSHNHGSTGTTGTASYGSEVEEDWWNKYPVGSAGFGRNLVNSARATMLELDPKQGNAYTPVGLLFPELQPFLQWLAIRLPDKRFKESWKAHDGLREGSLKVIEAWKQQRTNTDGTQAVSGEGVLARVLNGDKQVLKLHEIIGLVVGTVIAGYETTGSTLAMACYYMAINPEVQAKAHQEVDEVLAGKALEAEDLERLPYVRALFDEALRLSPPGTFLTRQVTEEWLDLGNGMGVPKGTWLGFPAISFMRDPAIWPHAEEFLPERHIQPGNEHLAPSNPGAYMPFGHGARMCAGYKFALLEARLTLARLLQHFGFEAVPGMPPPTARTSITWKPDSVVLRVVQRKRSG